MRWSWLAVGMVLGAGCQCAPTPAPTDAGVVLQAGQLAVAFDGDFGEVPRRQVVERVLRFTNIGAAPAGVQGLAIDAGDFSMDLAGDFVVPAGGGRDVTVRFQPTRNGAQVSELSFTPDARAQRFTRLGLAQPDAGVIVPAITAADARAVPNLQRLAQLPWFQAQGEADQRLSVDMISRLSTHAGTWPHAGLPAPVPAGNLTNG